MKWSEQMRVLQSEDEHYNQLMYGVDEGKLYINGKFITDVYNNRVSYYTTKEIKKEYPFFTDENFLLHCVFKYEEGGYEVLEKTKNVCINETEIKICSHSGYYLYIKTENVPDE